MHGPDEVVVDPYLLVVSTRYARDPRILSTLQSVGSTPSPTVNEMTRAPSAPPAARPQRGAHSASNRQYSAHNLNILHREFRLLMLLPCRCHNSRGILQGTCDLHRLAEFRCLRCSQPLSERRPLRSSMLLPPQISRDINAFACLPTSIEQDINKTPTPHRFSVITQLGHRDGGSK